MSANTELIGLCLLHFLWQGCVLGAVLWIALKLSRRADARVRYAMCCIAMVSLALCPIGTAFRLYRPPPEPQQISYRVTHVSPTHLHIVTWSDPPHGAPSSFHTYLPIIVALWCCGVAVLSLRLLGGLWVVERLRRRWSKPAPYDWQARMESLLSSLGISRKIELRVSDRIKVPSAIGVFRLTVILPSSLLMSFPPDHVECLILHELAHVRRHDYLVNLLQSCIETLLFYHPVVWWVSHTLRVEREHCCDQIVIRATGNSKLYARALTQLEQQLSQAPRLSMSARGGHLMNRVARILSVKQPQRDSNVIWPSVILLTALAVGLGETVHAQTSQSKPVHPPHKSPKTAASKHKKPTSSHHTLATKMVVEDSYWLYPNPSGSKGNHTRAAVIDLNKGDANWKALLKQGWVVSSATDDLLTMKSGSMISMRLDGVSFSEALRKISSQVGFSFAIAPATGGSRPFQTVHVNLVQKSLADALKAVCYSAGATYRMEGGTYFFEVAAVSNALRAPLGLRDGNPFRPGGGQNGFGFPAVPFGGGLPQSDRAPQAPMGDAFGVFPAEPGEPGSPGRGGRGGRGGGGFGAPAAPGGMGGGGGLPGTGARSGFGGMGGGSGGGIGGMGGGGGLPGTGDRSGFGGMGGGSRSGFGAGPNPFGGQRGAPASPSSEEGRAGIGAGAQDSLGWPPSASGLRDAFPSGSGAGGGLADPGNPFRPSRPGRQIKDDGRTYDLNLKHATLQTAVDSIAKRSHLVIRTASTAATSRLITVEASGLSLEDAIRTICALSGNSYRVEGDSIIIVPRPTKG